MRPYKLFLLLACGLSFSSCERAHTCRCCGGANGNCDYFIEIQSRSELEAHRKCRNFSAPPGTINGYMCDLK